MDIKELISWLEDRANKSTSWLERTAYLDTIEYIKGKQ